jgi:hypothetical protein
LVKVKKLEITKKENVDLSATTPTKNIMNFLSIKGNKSHDVVVDYDKQELQILVGGVYQPFKAKTVVARLERNNSF